MIFNVFFWLIFCFVIDFRNVMEFFLKTSFSVFLSAILGIEKIADLMS